MHGKGITRTLFVFTLVGLVLFALGGTALAAPPTTPPAGSENVGWVGDNGPIPPRLGDPVASLNEVQWITVSGAGAATATNLTFTLCKAGGSPCTDVIPYNAPGSSRSWSNDVQDRLTATAMFGSGNVQVVGGPASPQYANPELTAQGTWYYRVMFIGNQLGLNVGLLEVGTQPGGGVTVGVAPYQDGAVISPIPAQPHGGYGAATDYCLQCHAVHQAQGEYVLMRNASVTATCATCHRLNGTAPAGPYNPGFPGTEALTSTRAAYEVAQTDRMGEHAIGWGPVGQIPFGTASVITQFGDSTSANSTVQAGPGTANGNGGLYCASCHTPHGDFGQLINSKSYRTDVEGNVITAPIAWANNAPIAISGGGGVYTTQYLYKNTTVTPNYWMKCTAINGGGTCTPLTATDTEGESASLYGYKLLSSAPNHTYGQGVESWGMAKSGNDNARWCARCHDQVLPEESGAPAGMHNHPGSCTRCHGNPADGTSTDFPHTSTFDKLLADYPDLLCVNCHSSLA